MSSRSRHPDLDCVRILAVQKEPIYLLFFSVSPWLRGEAFDLFLRFHGLMNPGIDTHFVIPLVGVLFEREVAGVDVRHKTFAHHDLVEQALPDGYDAAVEADSIRLPDAGQLQVM